MATTKASRRNANQKSVLGTAVRNASVFTLKNAAKVVMAMLVITLIACAKEQLSKPASQVKSLNDSIEVLVEHYSSSLRTLTVSATPVDTLIKSDVDYQHTAVMQYADENGTRYDLKLNPTAYSYVRQSKDRIEVGSELEIPATLVSRKVISDKPFNNGSTLGRDKVEEFTYSDGNVDQVHYGYRYLAIISGGDTLSTPHIEFNELKLDSVHIEKYGEWTELDKPHRLTTHYSLSFTTKGVSNRETSSTVLMRPWRVKSITDVEQVLTGTPTYKERWIGCPITAYELTQSAPTNKGNVVTTKTFPVSLNIVVPELREQPSLDSLFAKTSVKGAFKCEVLGDSVKNEDGFVGLTFTGLYTSKNTGKENGTSIESTTTFTYTVPVKFENKWGSYNITAPELTFEEGSFTMKSESEDADFHTWMTTNTILPKFGKCEMDAIDEQVRIKVGKDKPAVPVDSVYTKGGKGDDYDVLKTVYYSDGSKREYPFSYTGHHSASAINFGEKITSSLNWTASALKANGSSKENDKKEFTKTTYFEATYTTNNMVSNASNGVESGNFNFSETHPIVVFVDGDTKITFDERKVILSGKGAQPAANYTLTVKDGISYKGYTYNMSAGVIFDGVEDADVTSQGLLLMIADEVGETTYKDEYVWNGNTLTTTVTKTTPHSFADDEVETYTKSVTVSMGDLQDGKVNAENINFTVDPSVSEKSDEVKDGVWTIVKRVRNINYLVSNGAVKREMSHEIVDYTLAFNDGAHSHTFDGKLNVTNSDKFGTAYTDGDYQVTPLTTTVTAVASGTGAPTLSVDGVTSIYIEQDKVGEVSYKAEESWSGNTFTAKVTRTTKHTKAQDEVKEFTKSVTVSMSDLSDDKVYAANTNFGTTSTDKENSSEDKDGQWTIKNFSRDFTYVVSNGAVKREMNNNVKDAEIVFAEGGYTHTFNARLTVSSSDKFGSAKTEGDYTVTPLTTTVKAVGSGTNAPSLSTKGVTSIYVENPKEISYRFTYKVDEVDKGKVYADMLAERLVNGKVEKSWSCWGLAGMFGEYKPDVEGIWVTNTKFRDNYSTTNHDTDPGAKDLGDAKAFERENVSKIENHLSVLFDANPDADGNTTREVAGHINLWSYRYTFVDPDNGHKETLDFTVTCKTTTHTVKDGIYTRVVEILLNGEKVDTQTGTVKVTVQ